MAFLDSANAEQAGHGLWSPLQLPGCPAPAESHQAPRPPCVLSCRFPRVLWTCCSSHAALDFGSFGSGQPPLAPRISAISSNKVTVMHLLIVHPGSMAGHQPHTTTSTPALHRKCSLLVILQRWPQVRRCHKNTCKVRSGVQTSRSGASLGVSWKLSLPSADHTPAQGISPKLPQQPQRGEGGG